MVSMVVGNEEMKKIVTKLPDWGKDIRRMMAKKFQGYKYWQDGVRVDGFFHLMKKEGNRQWFVKYLHYRICGKGKRTRFRTKLIEAAFVDSNGRSGYYENKFIYEKESEIDSIEIVYRAYCPVYYEVSVYDCIRLVYKSGNLSYNTLPVEEGDVIDVLKYSNITNLFSLNMVNIMEEISQLACLYLQFPQIEFIYKFEDGENKFYILKKLLDLYKQTEYEDLKDWINIIRLSIKHKFLTSERINDRRNTNSWIYATWWKYVEGIKK